MSHDFRMWNNGTEYEFNENGQWAAVTRQRALSDYRDSSVITAAPTERASSPELKKTDAL